MNDSITRISLDIHSTSSKDTVNAKRGDTARRIVISLVDGGIPYVISKDCYAVFTAKKPDGNVVYNDCTIENNTIIYKLTEQTVAVEGRVNSEIKLYGADDKLITSPKFTIAVFGTVYDEGDEIESSDEFNALTHLVSEAMEATENANKAAEKAAHTAKALMIVGEAYGKYIHLYDAIKQYLVGLRIFGKTTQNGIPTPDAPVDLVSVGNGGNIGLTVVGKNLVDITKATPTGTERIEVKNDTIVIGAGSGLYGVKLGGVVLEVGKTYTMSVGSVSQHDVNFGFRIIYDDDTSSDTHGNKSLLTITVTKPIKSVYFYVGYGVSATSQIVITQLQIEEGAIRTAYEPYQGQSLAFATPNGLRGIPVTSGGNYTDSNGQRWICDEIDLTRGVFTKRIGIVILNGLETWYHQEANKYFYTVIQDREMGSNLLCDSLVENPVLTDSSTVGWWAKATDNSLFVITGLENAGIASAIGELKTYLADNPITVQYVLKTPIETPLTEEELAAYAALHTYKDHTTVSNSGHAYMELEYAMDAKKYIDSLVVAGGASAGILDATVE